MDRKGNPLGDLSTNFSSWEFRCPCRRCRRKKVKVSELLLFKLEKIVMIIDNSVEVHKPVIVLSGNRCEEENKRIGGFPNSKHIPNPYGEGVDITVEGMTPIELGLVAEEVGGLRIGIAKWGIHVDVGPPSPSKFWCYGKDEAIYSAKIENESLLKFYQIIKKGG